MLNLKLYEEAVEFALTALDISITLGMENLQHKIQLWIVILGCICPWMIIFVLFKARKGSVTDI